MKKIISKFLSSTWNWILGKTTIDDKIVETAKEVKRRAKNIKEEIKDVGVSISEVGDQLGDVVDAAKGQKRKGRKKKNVK